MSSNPSFDKFINFKKLVNEICFSLGVTRKHLSSLLDISPENLSILENNRSNNEIHIKNRRRLESLFFAIEPLEDTELSPIRKLSVLKTLIYKDKKGNPESIFSLLKKDICPKDDILRTVVLDSLKYQRELTEIDVTKWVMSDNKRNRLTGILSKMAAPGTDKIFTTEEIGLTEKYEGLYDLFCLWDEETEQEERILTLKAIQEEIDEVLNYGNQSHIKNPRSVMNVIPRDDFKVYVFFRDGQIRLFDMLPLLGAGVFLKITDKETFIKKCVVINGTLGWDVGENMDEWNCIDICPDSVYEQGTAVTEADIEKYALSLMNPK